MGLGVFLERLAGGFEIGDVEGHAAEAAGEREHLHAHGAAFARDNNVAHLVGFGVAVDGLLRLTGDVLVEHDLAVEHVVDAGRADGFQVGAVHPLQLAGAGHAPGGEGRLAEHFEEGHRVARDRGAGLFNARAGAGLFKALDGGVGDPEHGAGAGGAAIGFEEAAGGADDGERERRAVLAELLQALAQGGVLAGAVAGFEIGETFEDADARIFGRAIVGETENAHEGDGRAVEVGQAPFGLVLRTRGAFGKLCVFPDHDDAGVGAEDALGAGQLFAGLLFLLAIFPCGAAGAIGDPQGPEQRCNAKCRCACDEQDERLGEGHVHGRRSAGAESLRGGILQADALS